MANKKPTTEIRTLFIRTRLTWPEANSIAQKAACKGVSVSNYVREALGLEKTRYRPIAHEDIDKAQLSKFGRKI